MNDYIPWEFNEEQSEQNWFDQLRDKYKDRRAQILPKEQWQPLIETWRYEHPDPDYWFRLHVKPDANAGLYRKAMKRQGFAFTEVENKHYDTPIYLETPLSGLDADQYAMLEMIRDLENRNGILYYRNIPAPVVDLLYEEVFEERLVYPERFD